MKWFEYLGICIIGMCIGIGILGYIISIANRKDINIIVDVQKNGNDIDSLQNDCFELVTKRLDRLDSVLLEK